MESIVMLTIMVKIVISPLDYASALMLIPVVVLYVAKVIVRQSKLETEAILDKHSKAIESLEVNQREVMKIAEEAKTVLSKLNLQAAFGNRISRNQG
ncbi:MAG: hypothetical protein HC838_00060 [Spirulinaceae cyanobacterium RM2_2_10]|nr:hypothetical protein [Spirulinaceae cyanobacterium RM2_2_10]